MANPEKRIRQRGAQPGNQNALKHGHYTEQAKQLRRLASRVLASLHHTSELVA